MRPKPPPPCPQDASGFRKLANKASSAFGSPWAFFLAVLIVVGWAVSGPIFHFSQTWQLVINTGTTIVTFLMVFLIQSSQNRDTRTIHLKLDELLRVTRARHVFAALEDASDEELLELQKEFEALRRRGDAQRPGKKLKAG